MAREGCVCCPYPYIAIPGVISFAAAILTWIAAFNCNFFYVSYRDSSGSLESLQAGLWTVEWLGYYSSSSSMHAGYYCTGWYETLPDLSNLLDGALIAARAFGMISAVLGVIAFILIVIPSCVKYGDSVQYYVKILTGLLIVLGVFTLLDLVALASDLCKSATTCTLRGSGISAIVGAVLWWICAGLMFWVMNNPRQLRREETEDMLPEGTYAMGTAAVVDQPMEEKEVKTVQRADGSTETTTTTTVTNPDRSKTVTKTTEVMPPA